MENKQAVRDRVWELLEREGAARFPGARGRIPNFTGAEAAARRLALTEEWARAEVMKANPDFPQLPVRALALAEGKLLYMAVPRLRSPKPFLLLDPKRLGGNTRKAASIRGASAVGRPVPISAVRPLDLVVCGSVAVNRDGARIGKGGGFSDLEFAMLTEAGLVTGDTVAATTVHPVQVLNEDLPETEHDFRVDLMVTPDEVIRPARSKRRQPPGIIWSHLDEGKIGETRSSGRSSAAGPAEPGRVGPPPHGAGSVLRPTVLPFTSGRSRQRPKAEGASRLDGTSYFLLDKPD